MGRAGRNKGKLKIHFQGEAGPGASNVLAEGLYEGGSVPGRAVRVDTGDLLQ